MPTFPKVTFYACDQGRFRSWNYQIDIVFDGEIDQAREVIGLDFIDIRNVAQTAGCATVSGHNIDPTSL